MDFEIRNKASKILIDYQRGFKSIDDSIDLICAMVPNSKREFVPYQCCPVCDGKGQVVADGFTSAVYQPCVVCKGAMIIPMHEK